MSLRRLLRRTAAASPPAGPEPTPLSEDEAADVERARAIARAIGAPQGGVLALFGQTGTIVDLPTALQECEWLDSWGITGTDEVADLTWLRQWLTALADRLGI